MSKVDDAISSGMEDFASDGVGYADFRKTLVPEHVALMEAVVKATREKPAFHQLACNCYGKCREFHKAHDALLTYRREYGLL